MRSVQQSLEFKVDVNNIDQITGSVKRLITAQENLKAGQQKINEEIRKELLLRKGIRESSNQYGNIQASPQAVLISR